MTAGDVPNICVLAKMIPGGIEDLGRTEARKETAGSDQWVTGGGTGT